MMTRLLKHYLSYCKYAAGRPSEGARTKTQDPLCLAGTHGLHPRSSLNKKPVRPPVSPPFRAAPLRRVSTVVHSVVVVNVDDGRVDLCRLIHRGPVLVNPCHDKRAEPCHEHPTDHRHRDFRGGVRLFVRGTTLGIWSSLLHVVVVVVVGRFCQYQSVEEAGGHPLHTRVETQEFAQHARIRKVFPIFLRHKPVYIRTRLCFTTYFFRTPSHYLQSPTCG